MKTQQDIKEIYQELSYDDLTEVLNEWLNPSDSDSDEEEAPQKVTSEVSNTKVTSNT